MNLYQRSFLASGILMKHPSRFQGHYVNKTKRGASADQCQCHGLERRRTFFTFPKISRQRDYAGRQLVGFTMEQMFEVVSDVENYYKFVPWCKKSFVRYRSPGHLRADLIIGFPPINESYTSSVTMVKPYLVKAACTDGRIFHHMNTLWRFSPGSKKVQQSCVVDFQISFEFRSAFHSQLSNLFFDQVAGQMESAFITEASRRNGPPALQPVNLLGNKNTIKS